MPDKLFTNKTGLTKIKSTHQTDKFENAILSDLKKSKSGFLFTKISIFAI